MGRGFLTGIFWGGLVGLGLLVVSSQTMDRQQLSFPQPVASPVEVPGGSEFDQARPETDAVVPEPETRPEAEGVRTVEAPSDAVETPPAFDTSSLEVPTPAVESPGGLSDLPKAPEDTAEPPAITDGAVPLDGGIDLAVPEVPGDAPSTEPKAPVEAEAPVLRDEQPDVAEAVEEAPVETEVAALPQAETGSPAGTNGSTDTGTAPKVSTGDTAPAAPKAPVIGDETSLPAAGGEQPAAPNLPQIIDEPSLPSGGGQAPEVAEGPEAPTAPVAPETGSGAEVVTVDGGERSFLKPVESLGDKAADVDTDRLPQVGGGDTPATGALPTIRRAGAEETAEEPEVEVEVAVESALDDASEATGPALLVHGTDFSNPEGNPLLSIILIQSGPILSEAQLDGLPPHVALAINAGDENAAEAAGQYRAAGREVVMIPSLPQGATPQDVEQALRVNFDTVPQAVAVMDVSGGSFQSDRAAVSQVVDVVATTGHGLITFPRGLNTAHQRADRAGVATGLIFRNLDASGETAEQIRRTMDRAAFRARQDEGVILVGTTAEGTLGALVEWSMGNRSTSVTIAPISAALLGG